MSSGSTETTTEVAFLDSLESRSLLRYLAEMIVVSFRVLDGPLEEGIQFVVVVWEDGTRD